MVYVEYTHLNRPDEAILMSTYNKHFYDKQISLHHPKIFVVLRYEENFLTLRKHAYSNILKILPPKNENFQMKILILFIFQLKT